MYPLGRKPESNKSNVRIKKNVGTYLKARKFRFEVFMLRPDL